MGFSDKQISSVIGISESDLRHIRKMLGVTPWVKQVNWWILARGKRGDGNYRTTAYRYLGGGGGALVWISVYGYFWKKVLVLFSAESIVLKEIFLPMTVCCCPDLTNNIPKLISPSLMNCMRFLWMLGPSLYPHCWGAFARVAANTPLVCRTVCTGVGKQSHTLPSHPSIGWTSGVSAA